MVLKKKAEVPTKKSMMVEKGALNITLNVESENEQINQDLGEVSDAINLSDKKSMSKISEAKSKYHLRA